MSQTPPPHGSYSSQEQYPQQQQHNPYQQPPKQPSKKGPLFWSLVGVGGILALVGLLFVGAVIFGVSKNLKSDPEINGEAAETSSTPTPLESITPEATAPVRTSEEAEISAKDTNISASDMFVLAPESGKYALVGTLKNEPPAPYYKLASAAGKGNQPWIHLCPGIPATAGVVNESSISIIAKDINGNTVVFTDKPSWIENFKKDQEEQGFDFSLIANAMNYNLQEGGISTLRNDYTTGDSKNCLWLLGDSTTPLSEPFEGAAIGSDSAGNIDNKYFLVEQ